MIETVVTVIVELAKCMVGPIGTQCSYFWNHKSNFDRLKKQVKNLKDAKVSVCHRVEEAERNGEEIEQFVNDWLIDVEKIVDEVEKMIEDEEKAENQRFSGLCSNLKTRCQLSKQAVRKMEAISGLKEEGKFEKVSYETIPPEIWIPTTKGFEFFESRVSTLRGIKNALSDPDVNMIGVYGMGGVGKTTLVKEIAKEAEKDMLFDQVVFATISPTPDIKKVQGEIADKLGLEFHEESESGRARKLCERLRKEKKVLVVLDNIWTKLDLETIGIPFGDDHKGCKVLLTARDQDVLSGKMNCEKNFPVSILNEQESWSLFKKIADDRIENSDVQSVATEIAKKCGDLPIVIATIASALRNKRIEEWKNALQTLKRPGKRSFEGVQAEAYSTMELSYDHLEGEELKSVFLLCSLIPDGTPISYLLKCIMGLDLLQGISKIEEARNRIYTLVRKLQACCLLLEGKTDGIISMHDVVRDVALSIAYRDQHVFTVRNEVAPIKWPDMDTQRKCTAITLFESDIGELPKMLECSQLRFFFFENNGSSVKISDNFFARMEKLQVLDLTAMQLLSLPSSIALLVNLRTLCLDHCVLGDITIVGELKKLEILSLYGSDIDELPKEIDQLSMLRILDLSNCSKLKVIPPNVLSSLSQLEELCMINTFVQWEIDGLNSKRRNSSLHELKHLHHLTNLEIRIKDAKMLPKGIFSQKLGRYTICTGDIWDSSTEHGTEEETTRALKLKLNTNVCMEDDVIMLLREIEVLYLDEVQYIRNVLCGEYKEGFPQLKHLYVQNNPFFLCLMESMVCVPQEAFPSLESLALTNLINLEKIFHGHHGQLTSKSFGKLRIIRVKECYKLKNIFSRAIFKNLPQLQTIEVTECRSMEEIFVIEKEDNFKSNEVIDRIEFGHLGTLTLKSLPQLRSFCSKLETPSTSGRRGQKHSSGEELDTDPMALFSEMVMLPNLETLEVYAINSETIWPKQIPATSSCIQSLTRLIVGGCDNLKYVFSSSTVRSFLHLQHLEICSCSVLTEIIVIEKSREEEREDITFPQLKFLKINDLPSLTTFCSENHIDFPLLRQLQIKQCPEFKAFISVNELEIQPFFNEKVAFPELEEMVISCVDSLEMIWHNELAQNSFGKLKSMKVRGCNKLQMTLFPPYMLERLPSLESVTVDGCGNLKNIFPVSIASSLLQLENLKIWDCRSLEEIVCKEEGAEASSVNFVFPKVTLLSLFDLPQLSNFCNGAHASKWPMLKALAVVGCGKANAFGLEILEKNEEGQIDIPAQQQQPLFLVEKINPSLEELILNRKNFTMIWHNQFQGHFFGKLKHLSIQDDQSDVFQFGLLERFYNLELLRLRYSSYKELLSFREVEKHVRTLARIKTLELRSLSDLKHLWIKDSKLNLAFQNLEYLEVKKCDSLIHLLPPSASFQNLTTLIICDCNRMMKLVTSSTANSQQPSATQILEYRTMQNDDRNSCT